MNKVSVREILLFFLKFCIVSIAVFIFWHTIGVEWYIFILSRVTGVVTLIFSPDVAYVPKGRVISLICSVSPLVQKKIEIQGFSLTANIVPLISLLAVTPGTSIRWKAKRISLGILLLFFTHMVHLLLDLLVVSPRMTLVIKYYALFPVKYYLVKGGAMMHLFFEQVGRELFPFAIWFLFASELGFKRKRHS